MFSDLHPIFPIGDEKLLDNFRKVLENRRLRALAKERDPKRNIPTKDVSNLKFGEYSVCISHCQGVRPTQEDSAGAYAFSKAESLERLSEAQITTIFTASIAELSARIKMEPEAKRCGSTLSASLVINKRIFVANIGDSRTVLLGQTSDTGSFGVQTLTWDHYPINSDELKRIREAGGEIIYRRATGGLKMSERDRTGLAISRSLTGLEIKGLSDEADITAIRIGGFHYLYLLNYCDGISETMALPDIDQFVREEGADNLTTRLIDEAYLRGSHDNISVVMAQIPQDPGIAMLSFVADGHGGTFVSQFIKEYFYQIFLDKANAEICAAGMSPLCLITPVLLAEPNQIRGKRKRDEVPDIWQRLNQPRHAIDYAEPMQGGPTPDPLH